MGRTTVLELEELLEEYDRARAYTDALWLDLSEEELQWRPRVAFSPIGWHLGHQALVAHFMVRNLIAAESSPDSEIEHTMDSANPEANRGEPPPRDRIADFRDAVARRVDARLRDIANNRVKAPLQLRLVGQHLLVALTNHEYQHDQWISEVRRGDLGLDLPPRPKSPHLAEIDGYTVVSLT